MRSVSSSGRTARAVILEESLRLFAEYGEDAVTMRQIAEAAGVSPALVIHHFGSKAGLREAVVERVIRWMDEMVDVAHDGDTTADLLGGEWGSMSELMDRAFPEGSAIPAYLRRLFLTGDPASHRLLRHWHSQSTRVFRSWDAAGLVDAGPDPEARAAILLSADLGLMFLREQLTDVLGADPLGDGMQRWVAESMRIYAAIWPDAVPPPSSPSGLVAGAPRNPGAQADPLSSGDPS